MSLISIITINFNNAIGLTKTIESVINQTFENYEFIIVDGGSTDNSVDVIKQNKRINDWISERDQGIYDAQNKGISKSSGEYLLFLNSGDVLAHSDVLRKVSTHLSGKKSFYYGNLILDNKGIREKHVAPQVIDLDFMLNSTFWHPCVFIRAELFKLFGLYNTSFKIVGDYEFFIRCLLKPNITTEHINEFITLFDGSGISNDNTQADLQTRERENAWKMNLSADIYESLKKQNAFSRSKYASAIKLIQKLRGKQDF